MADKPMRVLRAYSLPVDLFDHLNAIKRRRQADIDRRTGKVNHAGDPDWISTSEALSGVLREHRMLTGIAERAGASVASFLTSADARRVGGEPEARPHPLPADLREHLEAYHLSCGLPSQADALLSILRTHKFLGEMSAREGRPLSSIPEATRIANEWHREGFRGEAVRASNAPPAHPH